MLRSWPWRRFLSTLSLRRATRRSSKTVRHFRYFYPRSPCGERLINTYHRIFGEGISIHALLAESDTMRGAQLLAPCVFLSTLSLRRATVLMIPTELFTMNFYPRSPCGERPLMVGNPPANSLYFYPRSPCGERQPLLRYKARGPADFYPRSPCGERPRQRVHCRGCP